MRRIGTNSIKWIIPILFIGYYCCVSFYAHIHVDDGEIILHSHPFSRKANSDPHQHNSTKEIILFHTLSSILIADGAIEIVDIEKQFPLYITRSYFKESAHLFHSGYGRITPRAPPFV